MVKVTMDQCAETVRTIILLEATEEEEIYELIQNSKEEDLDNTSALVEEGDLATGTQMPGVLYSEGKRLTDLPIAKAAGSKCRRS
mmetsp:Transcript_12884/g.18540  ORF Transcript_12884/g.18540 Transcript_12884/m.18540 type:complete len:85 (+) Transcript_12884:245-499(+)